MQRGYDYKYSCKLAAIWKYVRTTDSNRTETDYNTADDRSPLRITI